MENHWPPLRVIKIFSFILLGRTILEGNLFIKVPLLGFISDYKGDCIEKMFILSVDCLEEL